MHTPELSEDSNKMQIQTNFDLAAKLNGYQERMQIYTPVQKAKKYMPNNKLTISTSKNKPREPKSNFEFGKDIRTITKGTQNLNEELMLLRKT